MAIQTHGARAGLHFHHSRAHTAHPCLPTQPRMDPASARSEGAASRALRHIHRVLLRMLLRHGAVPHTTFHDKHTHSGAAHTDCVRAHQHMVEDIHPYSGHRWSGGCTHGFRLHLHVQPHMVALPRTRTSRSSGHKPHDSASAHTRTGGHGICHRMVPGLLDGAYSLAAGQGTRPENSTGTLLIRIK